VNAVETAAAVAREHGLRVDDPVALGRGSNTMVLLRPAPVVARVMTGTVVLHDDPCAWLTREVAVGTHLAAHGAPAVAPADELPPGPHERDGVWLTFWRYVEHEPGVIPPAADVGRSLRVLHDALASFEGELEPFDRIRDEIEQLGGTLDDVAASAFDSDRPRQALHGDVSLTNILTTPAGLVWNDLEDVCKGPVEWDVAGLVDAAERRDLGERYVAEFLAAYDGPTIDALEPFMRAGTIYGDAWRAYRASR
jgi:hypothetical protein